MNVHLSNQDFTDQLLHGRDINNVELLTKETPMENHYEDVYCCDGYKPLIESPLHERILIGEHISGFQDIFRQILGGGGATLTMVKNGHDAVSYALNAYHANQGFHLTILDIHLPGLDGYNATALLRGNEYPLPIVSFGGDGFYLEQLESEQAGCNLHIARIGISSGLIKALELIDDILAK